MFRPKNPAYKEVWHTASLYHLVHTAALLGAPITKRPNIVSIPVLVLFPLRFGVTLALVVHTHCAILVLQFGGLLTAGIVFFSGTCYTVAYLEDRKFSSPAPLGGFAFIAAWASLLF
ncbi:hypothetical protein SEVIR_9G088900v4 [Setaria viridis]